MPSQQAPHAPVPPRCAPPGLRNLAGQYVTSVRRGSQLLHAVGGEFTLAAGDILYLSGGWPRAPQGAAAGAHGAAARWGTRGAAALPAPDPRRLLPATPPHLPHPRPAPHRYPRRHRAPAEAGAGAPTATQWRQWAIARCRASAPHLASARSPVRRRCSACLPSAVGLPLARTCCFAARLPTCGTGPCPPAVPRTGSLPSLKGDQSPGARPPELVEATLKKGADVVGEGAAMRCSNGTSGLAGGCACACAARSSASRLPVHAGKSIRAAAFRGRLHAAVIAIKRQGVPVQWSGDHIGDEVLKAEDRCEG